MSSSLVPARIVASRRRSAISVGALTKVWSSNWPGLRAGVYDLSALRKLATGGARPDVRGEGRARRTPGRDIGCGDRATIMSRTRSYRVHRVSRSGR